MFLGAKSKFNSNLGFFPPVMNRNHRMHFWIVAALFCISKTAPPSQLETDDKNCGLRVLHHYNVLSNGHVTIVLSNSKELCQDNRRILFSKISTQSAYYISNGEINTCGTDLSTKLVGVDII